MIRGSLESAKGNFFGVFHLIEAVK